MNAILHTLSAWIDWMRRFALRSQLNYSLSLSANCVRNIAQMNATINRLTLIGEDASAPIATRELYYQMMAQEEALQAEYRRELLELGERPALI